jgi:hypothetical protein
MAWQTGQRICSGPSAFWCPNSAQAAGRGSLRKSASGPVVPLGFLLLGTVFAVSLTWGQSPGPSNVGDCRPCSFSPGERFPAYSFTFDLKTVPEGRTVEAIGVARDSKPVQRLPVAGMPPVGKEEQFFFGGVDINFDGLLDLMLITRRGVTNAYAEYWVFDPETGMFKTLGAYPVFRVDVQKRRLSTYERGGAGGLIHEAKEYAFLDGKLALMRDEKQDATQEHGIFRKVVRERIGGVMKITKTETVRAPK